MEKTKVNLFLGVVMNSNQLKNIIVLKDLPSNLIEEAFIILKNNKKTKSLKTIDKNTNLEKTNAKKDEFIVKEAEMIISSYLSKIEKERQFKSYSVRQIESKYKRLKFITIALGSLFFLNILLKAIGI